MLHMKIARFCAVASIALVHNAIMGRIIPITTSNEKKAHTDFTPVRTMEFA